MWQFDRLDNKRPMDAQYQALSDYRGIAAGLLHDVAAAARDGRPLPSVMISRSPSSLY
jgi:hypothetical protein